MSETVLELQETQWTQEEMLWTLANLAQWPIDTEELATFRKKIAETNDLLSPDEKELLSSIITSKLAERARLYYFQHVQWIGEYVSLLSTGWMLEVSQAIYQRVKIKFDKTMQAPIQDDVLLELARLYLQLQGQSILSITVGSEWNIAQLVTTRSWAYSRVANGKVILSENEGEGKILFPNDDSLESSAKRLLLYITLSDLEECRDIFQSYNPRSDLQKLHLATGEGSEISEELRRKYTELYERALAKLKQTKDIDTLN